MITSFCIKKVLLLVALGWFAALALSQAASPRDVIEQMIPLELVLSRADEIGLSPEQRQAVQQGAASLQVKLAPLLQQMRRETDTLVGLLRQEKPDEQAVLAQFDKLNAVEGELKRLQLQMTLRTKAVLTTEQQAKALTFQASRLNGGGSISGNLRLDSLPAKLQRIKQGIEQWKREGRDVARINELWEQFRAAEAKGFYGEARKALDEALNLLDAPATSPDPAKP